MTNTNRLWLPIRDDRQLWPNFRTALVYEVASKPGLYRIHVEKHPETQGWTGGRVLWNSDTERLSYAVRVANEWVFHGILPKNHVVRDVHFQDLGVESDVQQ